MSVKDCTATLRISGDNLVVAFTVLDQFDVGIEAGQTVTFSILRLSDLKYWNVLNNKFDLPSEPALINAPHDADGVYEKALSGGYVANEDNYRIHSLATGAYSGDASFVFSLNNDKILSAIQAALALGNTNLKNISTLNNDVLGLKRDIKLLIASNERMKKGRL